MECMDVDVIASMDSVIVIILLCFINALLHCIRVSKVFKSFGTRLSLFFHGTGHIIISPCLDTWDRGCPKMS